MYVPIINAVNILHKNNNVLTYIFFLSLCLCVFVVVV